MNKQEAIDQLKESLSKMIENIEDENDFNKGYRYATQHCFDIINQLDESEKPVVPKFVAEWIEYCKSNKLTLLGAFDPASEHGIGLANTFTGEVWKGIDWAKRNQDTFARAWLDGYEVEKEKLYTVEIPNPNLNIHIILQKTKEGIVLVPVGNVRWKGWKSAKLTEAEIKKDFEWLWQFAKEVEGE